MADGEAASDAQTEQISIDIIASDAGNAADPAKTKDAVTTCISNSSLTAPSEYEEKEKPVPKRLATAKPPPVHALISYAHPVQGPPQHAHGGARLLSFLFARGGWTQSPLVI